MKQTLKLFLLTLSLIGILQSNVSAGEVEQRAFIERFYQNIMSRTADSGGMSTWLNVIQTESAAKVALGFFKSQEFLNKNLSNEQFVDILYSTLFDRQADVDGRTGWLNQLNTGTSKDEVMYGFFNAQEFANLANRFGVTQIRPEDQLNVGTTGVDGYVNRFYTLVLNRNADSSGFTDWTNQLNVGTKAGGDIAKGFFNSQEYLNRGLDNSTFVDICYRAFFNREADTGGKSNWITQLNQGASKDAVLDGFIDSQEFINLANGFGIKNRITSSSTLGYTLLAWNDLGMHCFDGKDFSIFSILPPYNNLNAHLIKKDGTTNKHIKSGVTITYQSLNNSGHINTSSNNKTNFWDYLTSLFPSAISTINVGLTGNKTPSNSPQNMTYNQTHNWWEASGIPIVNYDDNGNKDYYPMVKVIAKDTNGNTLATADVVLPVSDEMDCAKCHASNVTSNDAKPAVGWSNNSDLLKDYKLNILRLHDEKHPNAVTDNQANLTNAGYTYNNSGLETTALAGTPILCATCHKSNALATTGFGIIKPLTEALHSKHATVIDPVNGLQLNNSTNRTACYSCHPGGETECLRGAMGSAKDINGNQKMQCQSCHGNMSNVGASSREGWLDQPNCQVCHQNGQRYESAIENGTLRAVLDNKFATNPNTPSTGRSLYRFSSGHGDLQCSSCHGSTHAIFPTSHVQDNIISNQIQGHSGTIAECSSCHTTVPTTLSGGPHGMHTVGQDWTNKHKNYAENNPSQCKTCHGNDYRGSALSKTFTSRSFNTEHSTKTYEKGVMVSCYDCHNGPKGD